MNAVVIFARYPNPGEVKTRLAKTLGTGFAVRFYKLMAEHIFRVCSSLPGKEYDLYIFYDKEDVGDLMSEWVPSGFTLQVQEGIDLGMKMKSAFSFLFKIGFKKVVIIGTDCPGINVDLIMKAFEALSRHDLTLGPSDDGGYYLLGMNRSYPFLFESIEWSSPRVLEDTLKKIKENRLSVYMLPELTDIDTEADLRRWLSETRDKNQLTDIADEFQIR